MVRQPETDESGLNMTPMIDIVFQLILFFMFNLRFKGLDHRIDSSLPKGQGIEQTWVIAPEIPSLRVAMSRERPEDPASPTKMKLGGFEFLLPPTVWSGDPAKDAALEARRDQVFQSLQAKMAALNANGDLKGRIEVRRPRGDAVPHADVVKVIDAFIGAGIKEVMFEGAPAPLGRAPAR